MITKQQIPTHENTVVSKQNAKLEEELSYKLNALVKVIREFIKQNPDKAHTIDELKNTGGLNAEVYDIIRSYVQQSYQLGTDYVTGIAHMEPRLTSNDLAAIKLMSDSFTARFWGRVQKQIFDLKIPSYSQMTEEMIKPNDKFSSNYIVNSLSIAITTMALNKATINKAATLLATTTTAETNRAAAANVGTAFDGELNAAASYKSLKQRINESFGTGTIYSQRGGTITIEAPPLPFQDVGVVYMWSATIDERTCPLCVSLHGQTWLLDDWQSIPDIPDGTHYNCRCRVMLVETPFAAQIAEQQAT